MLSTQQILNNIRLDEDGNPIVVVESSQQAFNAVYDSGQHALRVKNIGGGTSSDVKIKTAAEAIGGQRFVIVNTDDELEYADCDILSHGHRIYGISQNAGAAGDLITVLLRGEIENTGWAFDIEKPVFLGSSGLVTQTPPTSGFVLNVGYALASTILDVRIQLPLFTPIGD